MQQQVFKTLENLINIVKTNHRYTRSSIIFHPNFGE